MAVTTLETSPLRIIQDKERALREQVLAERKQAEALIANTREQAITLKEAAEREGQQLAEQFYQQEMAVATAQAAEIEAAGQKDAETLQRYRREDIERAARAILDLILPRGEAL